MLRLISSTHYKLTGIDDLCNLCTGLLGGNSRNDIFCLVNYLLDSIAFAVMAPPKRILRVVYLYNKMLIFYVTITIFFIAGTHGMRYFVQSFIT